MHKLCVSLITVALLACLPVVGLAAQSEEKVSPFTFVTGKVIKDSSPEEDREKAYWDDERGHVLDWRSERTVEWSDPRLPAEMVARMNMDVLPAGPDLLLLMAVTYRLDGPDGAWTGTGRGFATQHTTEEGWMVSLSGEGAYEGLSAMLVSEVVRGSGKDYVWFKGYVFEGDLPSMPDPVHPPVE